MSHLDGSALFALAKSCKDLDFRLQPSIWKYNIRFQNSNMLHLAVKYDNVGLAEALLRHNANINAFYRGKTPLMRALKYSSAGVRELLLNHRDLDINVQNQARESALWYTIHYGTFSTVKRVLEQPNVQVDVKHKHGRTALHLAVFAGRIGFVHLLLSSGSEPDLQDDSGHSPWDWACRFNRPVMEMIFSNDPMAKVFLGTKSSQEAELPLHQAVAYGSVEAVKRLPSQAKGPEFGHPEPEWLYAAPSRRSKQTLGNGQFAPKSPPCQRELQRQRWQYATLAVYLLVIRRDNRQAIGRERHQRQFCWRPREIRGAIYISTPRRGQVRYRAHTTAACGARDQSESLCWRPLSNLRGRISRTREHGCLSTEYGGRGD